MFLYWSDVLSLLLLSSKKSGESETTPTTPTTPTSPSAPTTPTSPTTPTLPPRVTSFPPPPVTTDSVRNKCRELLVAALQTDGEDGFILCFYNLETLTRPGGSLTSSQNEEHFKVRRIKKKKMKFPWHHEVMMIIFWVWYRLFLSGVVRPGGKTFGEVLPGYSPKFILIFFSSLNIFHGWNLSKNNKCFVCEMEF